MSGKARGGPSGRSYGTERDGGRGVGAWLLE